MYTHVPYLPNFLARQFVVQCDQPSTAGVFVAFQQSRFYSIDNLCQQAQRHTPALFEPPTTINNTSKTKQSTLHLTYHHPSPLPPTCSCCTYDTPENRATQACVAGTYKPAYGNHITLCLPCPTGSYSEAVGATSSSICEDCPLGLYGDSYGASSVSGCTECPSGTYGAVTGG